MNEELKTVEEDYLTSIRLEKDAYSRLLTAQEMLTKAMGIHQRARERCIGCLRKLNDAMNAARDGGV